MADNHDLLILPKQGDSQIALSEPRSNLAARGRKDASEILKIDIGERCFAGVRINEKWGFIRKDGTFIVEPKYGTVDYFSSKLAAFSYSTNRNEARWGYLDISGRVSVPEQFEKAGEFCEGLAAVRYNGKHGYIRRDGTFAIEPRFEFAQPFRDGTAVVRIGSKSRLVDKLGQYVGGVFDTIHQSSGKALEVRIGAKSGFVNRQGELLIDPTYEVVRDVEGGYAWSARVSWGDAVALISYDGDLITIADSGWIITRYDEPDGVIHLCSRSHNGHERFIDKDGNTLFERNTPKRAVGSFNDGVALVSCDSPYYVDKTGRRLTEDPFKAFGRFSGGRGIVVSGGRYGYIDVSGNNITPVQYLDASRFMDGYAQVLVEGDGWQWIDTSGDRVAEPHFNENGSTPLHVKPFDDPWETRPVRTIPPHFKEGFCSVMVNGKWGYVNTKCQVVIPPTYSHASSFFNGVAAVEGENGKWGFIDSAGELVMPCQFDQVRTLENPRSY
jgi:hypothetical protein